jgi:hypothetical protein
LRWLGLPATGAGDQVTEPVRAREAADGTERETVDRWPRALAGGARPAFGLGRPGWNGDDWRGPRSVPESLDGGGSCVEGFKAVGVVDCAGAPGEGATFLKVMVHLTSSPAKTTGSCQRTKTRMLLVLPLPLLPEPSGGIFPFGGRREEGGGTGSDLEQPNQGSRMR